MDTSTELDKCECGAPMASAGPIGLYCTSKDCPVEAGLIRQINEAFERHRIRDAIALLEKNGYMVNKL